MKRNFNSKVEEVCKAMRGGMYDDDLAVLMGAVELACMTSDIPSNEMLADYLGTSEVALPVFFGQIRQLIDSRVLKNAESSRRQKTNIDDIVSMLATSAILRGFFPYQKEEDRDRAFIRTWMWINLQLSGYVINSRQAFRGFTVVLEFLCYHFSEEMSVSQFLKLRYGNKNKRLSDVNAFFSTLFEDDPPVVEECKNGCKNTSEVLENLWKRCRAEMPAAAD